MTSDKSDIHKCYKLIKAYVTFLNVKQNEEWSVSTNYIKKLEKYVKKNRDDMANKLLDDFHDAVNDLLQNKDEVNKLIEHYLECNNNW